MNTTGYFYETLVTTGKTKCRQSPDDNLNINPLDKSLKRTKLKFNNMVAKPEASSNIKTYQEDDPKKSQPPLIHVSLALFNYGELRTLVSMVTLPVIVTVVKQ
jgi:hypothetical protein